MSLFPITMDQEWVENSIFVELASRHNTELTSSVLGNADLAQS